MIELYRRYRIHTLLNKTLPKELLVFEFVISILNKVEIKIFEKYTNDIYYFFDDKFYFYKTKRYKGYDIEILVYRTDDFYNTIRDEFNLTHQGTHDIISYLCEKILNINHTYIFSWEFSGHEVMDEEYKKGFLK